MDYNASFNYNPTTGDLTWKQRPIDQFVSEHAWKIWNRRFPGKVAGYPRSIKGKPCGKWVYFGGKHNGAHQIIMEMHFGPMPAGTRPDHIDGDSWNNRLDNLRAATSSQNSFNRTTSRNNTSGMKGVNWHRKQKKWNARIAVRGVGIHLGSFDTKGMAAVARAKAAIRYHGAFARLF
jgi:hypothetical protein